MFCHFASLLHHFKTFPVMCERRLQIADMDGSLLEEQTGSWNQITDSVWGRCNSLFLFLGLIYIKCK